MIRIGSHGERLVADKRDFPAERPMTATSTNRGVGTTYICVDVTMRKPSTMNPGVGSTSM